ncbi:hypothetical protein RUM44_002368 [Polyplax serrata]|uniref:ZP domain-containing protein n=1 Tax=Polyplax serrata TaxID=468196 RepID=A0ABR1AMN9_POLSC
MIRQTDNPSDLTVQNLLQWLQGRYESSGSRKARQQSPSREYLPSLQTQNTNGGLNKPRPFQRPQQSQILDNDNHSGSITPQGPYPQSSDQPGFESPFNNEVTSKKPDSNLQQSPNFSQEDSEQEIESSTIQPQQFEFVSAASVTPGFVVDEPDKQNGLGQFPPDDLNHPPHIHALDVQCAKDMMTITIEFNRIFNGVIYSKGFYNLEKCRYVTENSGQQRYTFRVSLDSCGTQFIDQFDQGGQAYLENVLVLQNEPGIQEVWDTVRTVRCLWEGSIRQDLSVSLVIGMLTQEVVTFNGDTGKARLDIQVGKGPFGAPANGVVKIGEPMTLVVYVEGDPGFDVVVRQCQARDSTGEKSILLFDERGCVLKPKLFGAFQKTRETGNTGASLIAYSYFSAFKFPDEMDLVIECNVELCKVNCEMCPEEQKLEPGRRRRDISYNETIADGGKKVSGRIRVLAEEDLTALEIREQLTTMGRPSTVLDDS